MFKVKNLFWFIPLLILLTYPLWQPYVADFLRPADDINVSVEGAGTDRYLTMKGVAFSQCKSMPVPCIRRKRKRTCGWRVSGPYFSMIRPVMESRGRLQIFGAAGRDMKRPSNC
jgi:hypothetical protein